MPWLDEPPSPEDVPRPVDEPEFDVELLELELEDPPCVIVVDPELDDEPPCVIVVEPPCVMVVEPPCENVPLPLLVPCPLLLPLLVPCPVPLPLLVPCPLLLPLPLLVPELDELDVTVKVNPLLDIILIWEAEFCFTT